MALQPLAVDRSVARGALTALLLATLCVTSLITADLPVATPAETSVLRTPRPLGDLHLVRADTAAAFDNEQLRGQWTLVYTGYLNCPDLCPTTLATLARLHRDLPASMQTQLQVAFASIDHQQDTAPLLASYTQQFSSRIIPLTGDPQQLLALTNALGFIDPPRLGQDGRQTTAQPVAQAVAHSSAIALINPDVQLHALFRYPHQPPQITATLKRLLM